MNAENIGEIIFDKAKTIGVDIYTKGRTPVGNVGERIVVQPRDVKHGVRWHKCFVDVTYTLPMQCGERAAFIGHAAHNLRSVLMDGKVGGYVTGMYDGLRWRYSFDSLDIGDDSDLCVSFANVRILFEILNVN